ncbi:BQ5605_C007g04485 [Microbotryum silenes-dioicae]|uniref:BQ5605_C007g04485 protein n=1 Tax=Microbotryum silenes-dioicae TaxID=796604 RepID=A0A2X0MBA4_9BASI|nr:BQ5605_C007g04485 [Microbotryum silenes-dioicae]
MKKVPKSIEEVHPTTRTVRNDDVGSLDEEVRSEAWERKKALRPKQDTTAAMALPLLCGEKALLVPLTALDKPAEEPSPVANSARASPVTPEEAKRPL